MVVDLMGQDASTGAGATTGTDATMIGVLLVPCRRTWEAEDVVDLAGRTTAGDHRTLMTGGEGHRRLWATLVV